MGRNPWVTVLAVLGVEALAAVPAIAGLRMAVAKAGIKYPNRLDLCLLSLDQDAEIAAVFTRNQFCAAPVQVAKQHLAVGRARHLIVNTGNANAGTGKSGLEAARRTCAELAGQLGADAEAVLPFSTGVIGEPLPVERIVAAIPSLVAELGQATWADVAQAIMTTDTQPKGAWRQVDMGGVQVTIAGVSKGSGMIKPNMATMLGYVATDASVDSELLQRCLNEAVARSFNRVTVDGDTSTNDACVLMATGRAGNERLASADSPDYARFRQAVIEVCEELARELARDGEGATRLVTVRVTGARDEAEAARVGFTVAESPLVKTALFAGDPNWGRILAAVGRAGIDALDVTRVRIWLDDYLICEDGGRAADYVEAEAATRINRDEVTIHIDLALGEAASRVWTCDFSYDYVKINAEYRT